VGNSGAFTLAGGTVSGNTTKNGGGVDNSGAFTLASGAISGNTASGRGGGVCNQATFIMESGAIKGNMADSGGGVYSDVSGTVNMTGGTVSGNTTNDGGGVYDGGAFSLSGGAVIEDTAYLYGGTPVTVGTPFTGSAHFQPDDYREGKQILKATAYGPDTLACFSIVPSADTGGWTLDSNGKLKALAYVATVTAGSGSPVDCATFQAALDAANSAGTATITLLADAQLTKAATIASGKLITLAPSGTRVLSRGGGFSGPMFDVSGVLNLGGGTGSLILDGKKATGTGNRIVTINRGATLNLNPGAKLTGGYAATGGGVYNDGGVFNLSGGAVSGNQATGSGGGVWNNGTFNLSGASVISDQAYLNGSTTIQVDASFTGSALYVVPSAYTPGRQVLAALPGGFSQAMLARFGILSQGDGNCWGIDTSGALRQYRAAVMAGSGPPVYCFTFQEAVDAASDAGTATIELLTDQDLTGTAVIGSGKNITLAASGGRVLSRGGFDGPMLSVNGSLTLDGATGSLTLDGKLRSGTANRIATVNHGATLNVKPGVVLMGGSATNGGGVYNDGGTLNLSGGAVRGNRATGSGSGVWNNGAFTLSGDAIVADRAYLNGSTMIAVDASFTGSALSVVPSDYVLGKQVLASSGTYDAAMQARFGIVQNDGAHYWGIDSDCKLASYEASVTAGGSTAYYITSLDAVAAANAAGTATVTLLIDQILGGTATIESGKNITLVAAGDRTVFRGERGPMFNVAGTLTLDGKTGGSLTVDSGGGTSDNHIVTVSSGGNLYLKPGVTLTFDNTDSAVYNAGTFTMTGGTISRNVAPNGGAVYNSGSFTMTGGTINGNVAVNGGGVYNSGSFTMTGGTISENRAQIDGGGVYALGGTFSMKGGTVSGNTAVSDGGGVYASGTTVGMTGGEIVGNTATSGGGVYSHGAFTLSGGAISGNTATGSGGGVFNYEEFTLLGGAIQNNTATDSGGGVSNHNMFIMLDSAISGNTAPSGSCVYNGGALSVAGSATVGDQVYMTWNAAIWVDPSFTGSVLYIVPSPYTAGRQVLLAPSSGSYYTAAMLARFGIVPQDTGEHWTIDPAGTLQQQDEASVTVGSGAPTYYSAFEDALAAANAAGTATIALLTDVDLTGTMSIAAGKALTLVPSGVRTLSRRGFTGSMFNVSGTLTLDGGSGSLTLDSKSTGGTDNRAATVSRGGKLYLKPGATLTGGYAKDGGAVYNSGTVSMTGGTIQNNAATGRGGGVYSTGALSLTGGVFSGNSAPSGGGIAAYGPITLNTANSFVNSSLYFGVKPTIGQVVKLSLTGSALGTLAVDAANAGWLSMGDYALKDMPGCVLYKIPHGTGGAMQVRLSTQVGISVANITCGGALAPAAIVKYGSTVIPGASVRFTYATAQAGTYTGTQPVNAGYYWIKAAYAGSDAQYYAPSEATASFTIGKATPVVTLAGKAVVYNGKAVAIGKAAVTGVHGAMLNVAVSYAYFEDVDLMKPLAKPPTNVGEYYATATVAASGNYESATEQAVLTIAPATPKVALKAKTTTYTGFGIDIGAATVTGLNGEKPSGAVSFRYYADKELKGLLAGPPKDAGEYYAVATLAALGNYASATSAAEKLIIQPAKPAVALSDRTTTYTGFGIAIGAATVTGANGETPPGAVTYRYYSDSALKKPLLGLPRNAGTWYVTATVAASGNYSSATGKAARLTIERVAPGIALQDKSAVYTGKSVAIGAAAVTGLNGETPPGAVTYRYYSDAALKKKLSALPKSAGSYYVTATVAASGNYESATEQAVLTITPATPSVVLQDKSAAYTGKPIAIGNASVKGANGAALKAAVSYAYFEDEARRKPLAGPPKNVGTYYVTATVAASGNYSSATGKAVLTITPATPRVALKAKTATYTGFGIDIGAATVVGVNGETPSGAVTYRYYADKALTKPLTDLPKAAGTYYATAAVAAAGNYSSATSAAAVLTIQPAKPTVTLSDRTATYAGFGIDIGAATVTGVNGETPSGAVTYRYYSDSKLKRPVSGFPKKVGIYYATATVAALGNYAAATSKAAKLTIVAAA
jgi:hypothetical protein